MDLAMQIPVYKKDGLLVKLTCNWETSKQSETCWNPEESMLSGAFLFWLQINIANFRVC